MFRIRPNFVCVLTVSLLGFGCDSFNSVHYRIEGVHKGSSDAAKIETIVRNVGKKSGLRDKTPDSPVSDTLVYFLGGNPHTVVLGARFCEDDVLVDLNGQFGPRIAEFESARRRLAPVLLKTFGSRFFIPEYTPTNCSGPFPVLRPIAPLPTPP